MIIVVDKSLTVFVNNIVVVRYVLVLHLVIHTYKSSSEMHLFRRLSSNVQLWYYIAITSTICICAILPHSSYKSFTHFKITRVTYTQVFQPQESSHHKLNFAKFHKAAAAY